MQWYKFEAKRDSFDTGGGYGHYTGDSYLIKKGHDLAEDGRYDAAIICYLEELKEIKGKYTSASLLKTPVYALYDLYKYLERYKEAADICDTIIKADKVDIIFLDLKYLALANLNEQNAIKQTLEEKVLRAKKLLKKDITDDYSYYKLAEALFKLGRHAESFEYFDKAISFATDEDYLATYHENFGEALQELAEKRGDKILGRKAIDNYHKALYFGSESNWVSDELYSLRKWC